MRTPADLAAYLRKLVDVGRGQPTISDAEALLLAAALDVAEFMAEKDAAIERDPFAPFDRGDFGDQALARIVAYRRAREVTP